MTDKDVSGLLIKIVFINKILKEIVSIVKVSLRIIDSKTNKDTKESS